MSEAVKEQKRKLTAEEVTLCSKMIKTLEAEYNYLQYQQEYTDLMVNKGLQMNFDKQKRELEHTLAEIKVALKNNASKVTTLNEQIKNGVTVKETKDKKGE